MNSISESLTAIGLAIMTISLVFPEVRRGFAHRRAHWNRQSWRRFIGLVALGLVLLAAALSMAIGVDHGVYHGMNQKQADRYFFALMALTLVASTFLGALLVWFIGGRPDRQISWPYSRRNGVNAPSR
jgi:hypothetical protein